MSIPVWIKEQCVFVRLTSWDVYAPGGTELLAFIAHVFGWTKGRAVSVWSTASTRMPPINTWPVDHARCQELARLFGHHGFISWICGVDYLGGSMGQELYAVNDRAVFDTWVLEHRRKYAEEQLTQMTDTSGR